MSISYTNLYRKGFGENKANKFARRLWRLCAGIAVAGIVYGASAQSITVAWNPSVSPNIGNYILFFGTSSGAYVFSDDTGLVTNAVLSGLQPGATYYFSVRAYDVLGNGSAFSPEITYTVPFSSAINPVVTWAKPSSITYGAALSAVQLNASANAPGAFSYNPPAGTILGAGNGQVITAVFTPQNPANYNSVTSTVTISVSQAPLTITANNATKGYGAAVPALAVSYKGFVNGDSAASLTSAPTLMTTATGSSPVGSYPITVSGGAAANYAISFSNGSLAVTPANLSIAANNASMRRGASVPVLTANYSGFVNGDTSSSLAMPVSLFTSATSSSLQGAYPIVASGATSPNYTISFVNGVMTVNPPQLVSLSVSAATNAIAVGQTQQLTATGVFSDNSTQNLTASAVWASSVPAVATVNSAGLVTAVASGGSSTLTASYSNILGTLALSVLATNAPINAPSIITQPQSQTVTLAASSPSNTNGLLGWWQFDEGSGSTTGDSSGNGYTGTLAGSPPPWWISGQEAPYALSFGGANSVTTSLQLPGYPFSFTAWIDPAGTSGICQYFFRSGAMNIFFYYAAGSVNQISVYDDIASVSTRNIVNLSAWQHVAVTVDATGNCVIYVNGVPQTTGNLSPSLAFKGKASIGSAFAGAMDDVRVYNRVLSASEITGMYTNAAGTGAASVSFTSSVSGTAPLSLQWYFGNTPITGATNSTLTLANVTASNAGNYYLTASNAAGAATSSAATLTVVGAPPGITQPPPQSGSSGPNTNGLLGWWQFDEGSGATTSDASGNGHPGTLGGAPLPSWVNGQVGSNALSFDGAHSTVTTPFQLPGYPFSFTGWINPSGTPGLCQYFFRSGAMSLFFFYLPGSVNQISAYDDIGSISTRNIINLSTWQHVAVTVDATGNCVIYVNGVCEATGGLSGSLAFKGNTSFGCASFGGDVDDVRIYNRVLSTAEITGIYTNGISGKP